MQRVQPHQAAFQIQSADQITGHGDFIGLFIDRSAPQVVLRGHRHGRQQMLSAAMLRFLPVNGHDLCLGGRTTQLFLKGQDRFLHLLANDNYTSLLTTIRLPH